MNIRYNTDASLVESIKESLSKNEGYCPCKLKKTLDTKCMCKEFRDFIKSGNVGLCHCGLYEAYIAE